MSPRQSPLGWCFLCGRVYTKASMARHVRKHLKERQGDTPLVWLRVTDDTPWAPLPSQLFWLDLEVPLDLPLVDLDDFLRAVWVDCCGHLSSFVVVHQGTRYFFDYNPHEPIPDKEEIEEELTFWEGVPSDTSLPFWLRVGKVFGGRGSLPLAMDWFTLGDIVQVVDEFAYKYDFGTTTTLNLRVFARYTGPRPEETPPIRVLSRNLKPRLPCEVCGQPSAYLVADDKGNIRPLCQQHADEAYDKGKVEYLYPLVNSPRTGLCGYDGPAQEKWKFEALAPE